MALEIIVGLIGLTAILIGTSHLNRENIKNAQALAEERMDRRIEKAEKKADERTELALKHNEAIHNLYLAELREIKTFLAEMKNKNI